VRRSTPTSTAVRFCVSADAAGARLASDDVDALVIAADWFVSPAALYAFGRQTEGAAVARFVDRGRVVAPVARMPVSNLRPLFSLLSEGPVSELINDAVPADAQVVEMDPGERHRLSDSVAIERCERKLFGLGSHRSEPWSVRMFERTWRFRSPAIWRARASPVTGFRREDSTRPVERLRRRGARIRARRGGGDALPRIPRTRCGGR